MHTYAALKLTIDGAQRVEVLFRRCSRTSPANGTHGQKQGRGINSFTILMYTVIEATVVSLRNWGTDCNYSVQT